MKFNLKMGEDFDFKLAAHTIHVRFVDSSHKSLRHARTKSKEDILEEGLTKLLKKLEHQIDPATALNSLLDSGSSDSTEDSDDAVSGDFGCYNTEEYTIYIRHPDNYSFQLSTFLHEFIHVIEHIYTIEFDHQHLNLLADMLAQVLMDNFAISKPPKNVRGPSK